MFLFRLKALERTSSSHSKTTHLHVLIHCRANAQWDFIDGMVHMKIAEVVLNRWYL